MNTETPHADSPTATLKSVTSTEDSEKNVLTVKQQNTLKTKWAKLFRQRLIFQQIMKQTSLTSPSYIKAERELFKVNRQLISLNANNSKRELVESEHPDLKQPEPKK